MDSGFLSSSEAPKAPESSSVASAAESLSVTPAAPMETSPSPEGVLESEAVHAQAASAITAPEPADAALAMTPTAADVTTPPDEVAEDVQKILEDGLEEAVVAMSADAKERFFQKGKEIGALVAEMVRTYKVEVKRVLRMLKEWLTTIPGVNRFFLEQEAKIKTDRILELERVRHEGVPA